VTEILGGTTTPGAQRRRAIVIDIEGTTSPTEAVVGTLFAFAAARMDDFLAERADEPEVRAVIDAVRSEVGDGSLVPSAVAEVLRQWSAEDRKVAPLKTVQGLIWAEGFASGELHSVFFDDVVPALRRWADAGVELYVYSSGSVTAQRLWFSHGPDGDLRALFCGWFDTVNAGPKREESSYQRIMTTIGIGGDEITFLSDVPAELDAAAAVGWNTVQIRRDDEPDHGTGSHRVTSGFAELGADPGSAAT
jgi:enolase-phosphatase E1